MSTQATSDEPDLLPFQGAIQPQCIICDESYFSTVYGEQEWICPRCKSLGDAQLRELQILKLIYDARRDIILGRLRKKVLNQYDPEETRWQNNQLSPT